MLPAMALRDLDPESYLGDPRRKQTYVTTLFDTIAPGYDRFTRLFSLGMDGAWKQRLAGWVGEVVGPGDLVLDLACGTGDLARAVGRAIDAGRLREGGVAMADRQSGNILALDPSAEMIRRGRSRVATPGRPAAGVDPPRRSSASPSIRFLRADMMALPVADGVAAAVTVGYGFRNVPDARLALREVARVLKPGGWLADLDFFLPEDARWRRLYLWYLRRAGRAVGRWWHDEPEAYGYIARSLERWTTPGGFRTLLSESGFEPTQVRRHLGGGICLHLARRRA